MAQIAYKVTSVDDLGKALHSVLSRDSNFNISATPIDSTHAEILNFSFASEPNTYFSIYRAERNVRDTTYPHTDDSKTLDAIFINMYNKPDLSQEIYEPYLPFTVDYVCDYGEAVASQCYIGNTQGTFELVNSLSVIGSQDYYIFFGEDWLAIASWTASSSLSYIICSCRSEQNGDGGYILSSGSMCIRKEDNKIFTGLWGGNLLQYYNKFGTYRPGYPVDYIDVSYCSVPYGSLRGFSQKIPPDAIRDYTIVQYTFTHNWYGHCTCSLLFDSAFTNKLPNYNNLVSYLDEQNAPVMSNTLNGISLLLPNYFFIDAAPLSTHEYKYVLDTPEMCYCSMYNMMGGNIVQKNYPVNGNKFMCFPATTSGEKSRKAGYYRGFAFKLPIRYDEIIEDDGSADIIIR